MEPSRPRRESATIHVVIAPEAPPAPADRRPTGHPAELRGLRHLLSRDVVAEDLTVERLWIDAEQRRSLAPMPAHAPQRREDVLPLHGFERRRHGGGGSRL